MPSSAAAGGPAPASRSLDRPFRSLERASARAAARRPADRPFRSLDGARAAAGWSTTLAFGVVLLLTPGSQARAGVLLSVEEALGLAFPRAEVERETVFLTETELAAASEAAGESVTRALVLRYVARRDGVSLGAAYLDVHRVRTLDETVFVVVKPDRTIGRIEVLSFDEPPDYLPRSGWYRQFAGRGLDDDLRLDRGIRAVSGATLTATATTTAARRVLAVHQAIENRQATQ